MAGLEDRSVTVLPDYMKVSALLALPTDLSEWILKVVPLGEWLNTGRTPTADPGTPLPGPKSASTATDGTPAAVDALAMVVMRGRVDGGGAGR